MSMLNVSVNFLSYLDGPKNTNPAIRLSDMTWSLQGLQSGKVRNLPLNLGPGDTLMVADTARSLTFTGGSSFSLASIPASSYSRLTGPRGCFRTKALDGDATTQWEITLNGTTARARFTGTGTAPTFTMPVGYYVTLASPFATQNQGDFRVVAVGADYVDFNNPIAVPETQVGQVLIYASTGVQRGDTVKLNAPFLFSNQGNFVITRVTDAFIEFVNENSTDEVVTGVTTGLVVYSEAYQWAFLVSDGSVTVNLNGDTGVGNIVAPERAGDLVNSPGMLLKRGLIYSLSVKNNTQSVVTGQVALVE